MKRILIAIVAALAIAVGFAGSTASAATPSTCAAQNHLIVHSLGVTGMKWQSIQPDEAAYFHISPCSILLNGVLRHGQRTTLILTPTDRVVARS